MRPILPEENGMSGWFGFRNKIDPWRIYYFKIKS